MTDGDPTKPDLSLVSTNWIIEELQRRHDALLIVRETAAPSGPTDTFIHFSGGVSRCLGLSARATQRLLSTVKQADSAEE
jgi:hypothetical protein